MSTLTLDSFLSAYEAVEKKILNSDTHADAKKSFLDALTKASMSDEKRAGLIQQFNAQVALGLPALALEKTLAFFEMQKQLEVQDSQKALIDEQKKTETQQTQNVIAEKELKLSQKAKNTADIGLVNDQKGILVEQKKGFTTDARHKILKSLTEMAGMLAQNDIPTEAWMVTEMKNSINSMKS